MKYVNMSISGFLLHEQFLVADFNWELLSLRHYKGCKSAVLNQSRDTSIPSTSHCLFLGIKKKIIYLFSILFYLQGKTILTLL